MASSKEVASFSKSQVSQEDPPMDVGEKKRDKPQKGGARRGAGSHQQKLDKFRTAQNANWDLKQQKKIQEYKVSLGLRSEDLFGQRNMTKTVQPPLEVPVSTALVGELCSKVSEVLHSACKLAPAPKALPNQAADYDATTLKWVVSLQLDAKLYNARKNSQYSVSASQSVYIDRVSTLFAENLSPIAYYLDCIGKFTIGEQDFIPRVTGEFDFLYSRLMDTDNGARRELGLLDDVPEGAHKTSLLGPSGFPMYVILNPEYADEYINRGITIGDQVNPDFLVNPQNFNWIGLLQFREVRGFAQRLAIDDIAERFSELRGRINKKLTGVFVGLELDKGSGKASQLVYTEVVSQFELRGTVEAWSPRHIGDDDLVTGALLGLGHARRNPLADRGVLTVMATIDTAAALQNMAEVLTRKFR